MGFFPHHVLHEEKNVCEKEAFIILHNFFFRMDDVASS